MYVTHKISPAVAAAPVELLAECDRGLELGGDASGNGVRGSQAGEPVYLVREGGLKWEPGQQPLAGREGETGGAVVQADVASGPPTRTADSVGAAVSAPVGLGAAVVRQ
ncbi:hypothetical protein ONA91_25800 [Micromonospora sp. DR5-3]|uniref:hypothetical protein n=1 Tax=unclassified Micromonospora TaxID=2617518 RepID=UPI0011D97CBF|nr:MULTISPECIES: hypothetical protein [unclassified Micromonospora]MCW3817868.1 hypothetical protein [Micromonospora sp. DR5-3]TYC22967.1 hypothetical protein FXF52_18085 [Micromonospora sp. MP36]